MAFAMTHTQNKLYFLYFLFLLSLMGNIVFWNNSKTKQLSWANIPPVPTKESASISSLGDSEIAYRMVGYFLQNTGNVGGHYESLKIYDYDRLKEWFLLSQSLDEQANYVPFMAAYFYGALEDPPKKLDPVIDYLAVHGQLNYPQKWRWLAQAVYLSRYKQSDLPKALKLAYILAGLKTDVAPWGRQMPAFVQLKMGNKQASYEVMVRMLASEHDKLPAVEVNEMIRFICTRTLEPEQAAKNDLCQKWH